MLFYHFIVITLMNSIFHLKIIQKYCQEYFSFENIKISSRKLKTVCTFGFFLLLFIDYFRFFVLI